MNLCVFYFFYNRYFTLAHQKYKIESKSNVNYPSTDTIAACFLSIKTFKTHIQIVIQNMNKHVPRI